MANAQRIPDTATPATTRGAVSRVLTGVWMALYLLVGAALPVADAQTSHADEVVWHWEDSERNDCPASHAADHCGLCHLVLGGRALPASATATLVPMDRRSEAPEGAAQVTPRLAFLDGRSSRAPPLG